ncbi:hypothetical protein KJ830_08925 [bacterium]|nr:hypothetical protein [bacterium]
MNEDSFKILNHLPYLYKTTQEEEYINFLWDAFYANYEKEKYQFAFIGYHMLFMSFAYFSIWKIKINREKDFAKALIGFDKKCEKNMMNASSPFTFSEINESNIFRFFKLVGCENDKIGEFTRLVKDRNDIAHSNGNIFFNSQDSLDEKIDEVLGCINKIQENIKCIIKNTFKDFLKNNWDNNDREWLDDGDQIREILIRKNYFSKKDIERCLTFDINLFKQEKSFTKIKKLFKTFQKEYSEN